MGEFTAVGLHPEGFVRSRLCLSNNHVCKMMAAMHKMTLPFSRNAKHLSIVDLRVGEWPQATACAESLTTIQNSFWPSAWCQLRGVVRECQSSFAVRTRFFRVLISSIRLGPWQASQAVINVCCSVDDNVGRMALHEPCDPAHSTK